MAVLFNNRPVGRRVSALLLVLTSLLAGRVGQAQQRPAYQWAVTCGVGSGQADDGTAIKRLAVDALGNTYVTGFYRGTVVMGSTTLTSTGTGDVFVAKLDGQGAYQWVAVATGAGGEQGTCVGVDNVGGVYVGGGFNSYSLTFGPGGAVLYNSSAAAEGFVAKLDAGTGQWQWARRAGGTGVDAVQALTVTSQGAVAVAGEFASAAADFGATVLAGTPIGSGGRYRQDVFVAQLSSGGQWQWAVRGGGGVYYSKTVGNLVADAAGFLYLGGSIYGPSPFTAELGSFTLVGTYTGNGTSTTGVSGEGELDGFVARLSGSGQWLWAVQGDAVGRNRATINDLASDGQGHLYVGGQYEGKQARIGNTVLLNQGQLQPSQPQTPSFYYYPNAFVARLDAATGTWGWAVRAGGADGASVGHIAADLQGRVYVTGNFPNGVLPVNAAASTAAQLDGATGNWRWADITNCYALTVGSFDHLYVSAYFRGNSGVFGSFTLSGSGPDYYTQVVARLGAGVLATTTGAGVAGSLQVWPNSSGSPRLVQVAGARPGAVVQVFDVLGRLVQQATMPATGPLALGLPVDVPAGVYVVRSGQLARQLIAE